MASLFAAGYFAVATTTGVLLSLVPDESSTRDTAGAAGTAQVVTGIPAPVYTTTKRTTTRATTTTTTPSVPSGYREVSGSFQLKTVVPTTWNVTTGSVATTQVATDPTDPRREVRFGGSPSEGASDLAGRIGKAAEESTLADYRKTSLERVTFHGNPAMRWDFEFTKNNVRRQASAFYWETQNVEYIIYASTTPDDWTAMQAIVQTMKDRARP